MEIHDVRALVADDMGAVDRMILGQLHSEVPLINQIGAHIVSGGGKRLRPLVVLLSARACGYGGERHIDAATIVEFIHTATLLHDDVVDDSKLRRGRETANALWGNAASVLVGDFVYSRSFQLMVALQNMRIMEIMAETTNTIAEGEVLQLLNVGDPDTSEQRYLDVILSKTAKLFEAAARLGAVLAQRQSEEEQALAHYGRHLGTAFQLVDDVLDYSADSQTLGKNVGDDLAEGKPTLPLIYAMAHGSPAQRQLIRSAIQQGQRQGVDEIIAAIESCGAISYTLDLAKREVATAVGHLKAIPPSNYHTALVQLAEFSVARNH
ncbi:MAG: octaprenyl diphosphate synthase [Candidatus Competibacterales bacterium]